MEYEIIYERSGNGWSAYVPELPGCTSAGADRMEIEKNIKEAIKLHSELLNEQKRLEEQ
jgi:predicted RNase H-like HicB family nuclease